MTELLEKEKAQSTELGRVSHWIGGQTIAGESGRSGPVYNPAKGIQTKEVDFASVEEVDGAVQTAKEAFTSWRKVSLSKRQELFFAIRELVHQRKDEIAAILTEEHGKVFSDARGEVQRGLEVVEYACGIPTLLKGGFSEQASTGIDVYSIRQPLGVVAGITPFNFPAMVPMWMWGPALACGNTFVLKPSEKDPSASLFVAQLLKEAGVPDGVFNVVHGDKVASYIDSGREQGAKVVADGRETAPDGDGFFLGVSLLDDVTPEMDAYKDEIFGPVLGVTRVDTYDEALQLVNENPYGNGTAIFTRDGGVARQFQFDVQAGMVGINVPIPVPVAYYSFGGWKSSLFGDTHIYGPEGINFYTRGKVVTSRWPDPATSKLDQVPRHGSDGRRARGGKPFRAPSVEPNVANLVTRPRPLGPCLGTRSQDMAGGGREGGPGLPVDPLSEENPGMGHLLERED